ncbi:MAG: lytic transglycosylase domain-containing protein [Acidobacteriota bacterium]|nr:lytic transglycosylase domain-containing protein [Acidobacteriota bacterium]
MRSSLILAFVFLRGIEAQSASASAFEASVAKQQASIAVQQLSLRNQAHAAPAFPGSFFVLEAKLPPIPVVAAIFDCDPVPSSTIEPLIENAAAQQGLSPNLLHAVIRQESAFYPCAVSAKGALGLMQLMPATADDLGVRDPFDPQENVDGGARLLKRLMDRYAGDLNRVLGAYNAGPARVDAANGIPQIPETMHYIETILGNLVPNSPGSK